MSTITEVQRWLNEHRGEYEASKANLSDPGFVRETLVGLRSATIGLNTYNPFEHPPHAAVALLIEAREKLGGVFEDLAVMETYEEYRGMVNEEGEQDG